MGLSTTVFGSGLAALVALIGEEVQVEMSREGQLLAILNGDLRAANDVANGDAEVGEEILVTVGGDGVVLRRRACIDVQTWPTMIVFDLGEIRITFRGSDRSRLRR